VKALSTGIGLQLHWIQPSALERRFELYSENSLLEDLRIAPDRTAYGTLTIANIVTERWIFKGTGFLKRRLTIREDGEKDDFAVYRSKFWGDGWVEFVKGSKFYWKSTSFCGTGRGFYNEHNELLFVLKPKLFDLLKIQSVVEIGPQFNELEELPLLLMLACYVHVLDSYASR
jgi:hypothetical protein